MIMRWTCVGVICMMSLLPVLYLPGGRLAMGSGMSEAQVAAKEDLTSWVALTIELGLMVIYVASGSRDVEIQSTSMSGITVGESPIGDVKVKKVSFFTPGPLAKVQAAARKVSLKLGPQWLAPFAIELEGSKDWPKVEFRNGEIMWHTQARAYAADGTQARIRNKIFVYNSGKWQESQDK